MKLYPCVYILFAILLSTSLFAAEVNPKRATAPAKMQAEQKKEDQKLDSPKANDSKIFQGLAKQGSSKTNARSQQLGLAPGDVITKINGVSYQDQMQALKALKQAQNGTKPTVISVRRQGKEKDLIWNEPRH